MSHEIESLKREVQQLKYELTRYIDREDHRRSINDLNDQIAGLRNEFHNEIIQNRHDELMKDVARTNIEDPKFNDIASRLEEIENLLYKIKMEKLNSLPEN